jgi:hypothetical protein
MKQFLEALTDRLRLKETPRNLTESKATDSVSDTATFQRESHPLWLSQACAVLTKQTFEASCLEMTSNLHRRCNYQACREGVAIITDTLVLSARRLKTFERQHWDELTQKYEYI